jgi:hypothetical protein
VIEEELLRAGRVIGERLESGRTVGHLASSRITPAQLGRHPHRDSVEVASFRALDDRLELPRRDDEDTLRSVVGAAVRDAEPAERPPDRVVVRVEDLLDARRRRRSHVTRRCARTSLDALL